MKQIAATASIRRFAWWALLLLTLTIPVRLLLTPVYGADLGPRSLQLSSSVASKVGTQKLRFSITTPDTLGSVLLKYCSNGALADESCTPPNGFDAEDVDIVEQSGQQGFSVDASNTSANEVVLTRSPQSSVVGVVQLKLGNIRNPSNIGTYFLRIQTFASTNATGPSTDYGAVAFAINADVSVSAEVPPYLIFCTGTTISTFSCTSADGAYINFGELSPGQAKQGSSQMIAATNAEDGYNISMAGTPLTSGNNVISPLETADVSRPGVSQFGLNLRANSAPAGGSDPAGPGVGGPLAGYGQANFFKFVSNDAIAQVSQPDDVRRYTVSYLVNVPRTQAPGVYVSTVTYVCFGNF